MKMHISSSLLFLFIGPAFALKQGDFGIFSACLTKNDSLRLACHYADCPKSPPFHCEFWTSNGKPLAKDSDGKCRVTIQNHLQLYGNKTTSYNCTLTRKNRKEKKHITIDYSISKGKDRIRRCKATTGLLLHPAPTLLWPAVILSLWRVLITDSQTT